MTTDKVTVFKKSLVGGDSVDDSKCRGKEDLSSQKEFIVASIGVSTANVNLILSFSGARKFLSTRLNRDLSILDVVIVRV